ncbi:hypothetical protein [Treponema sp. Marseille-Q4130]|uniref:hypothetical protein n=1 Tax=Treponema sp. Marseille-Q4130 TaxID=2766702 RepID=UPI00165260BD|nr:hypothetical protein [Treponema sp. Marseille-Q4130]MBC6720372.1 hypothetical protein [Treponema sp. Marseille-Q4130]
MANTIDNKNELDNYGVWVKRAPESEAQRSGSDDDFNFDIDLPDFSDIDPSATEKAHNDTSALEDVAIEDFLDNGFSEPPVPDDTIETLAPNEEAMPDFFGTDDMKIDPVQDSVSAASEQTILPELPESPDTAFAHDDTVVSPEAAVTEDVDLSDFGVDFSADEAPSDTPSTGSTAPAQAQAPRVDYDLTVSADDGAVPSVQTNGVPDSFDEEAKSLMDNAPSPRTESNDLLRQIVEDLSGLKNEISTLKTELAELKSRGGTPTTETQAGGFFSDLDEDETISLSGDELDNIMSSADFLNNESKVDALAEEIKAPAESAAAVDLPVVPDIPVTEKSAEEFSTDDFFIPESDVLPELPAELDSVSEEASLEEIPEEAELEELPGEDVDIPEETAIPKVDDILAETVPSEPVADVQNEVGKTEIIDAVSEDFFQTDTTTVDTTTTDDFFKTNSEAAATPDDFFKADSVAAEAAPAEVAFTDAEEPASKAPPSSGSAASSLPANLTEEIKSVLLYMDQLLEDLPEEKIVEFARSEQFATYKKLFTDLGLA